jgi:hypothetical protein
LGYSANAPKLLRGSSARAKESIVAKLAVAFGVALIVVGIAGYFGTGRQSWTALIPAIFGVVLAVLGWLAFDPNKRKHAMHAAAALAVLGIAGTVPGVIKLFRWMGGTEPERPAAVISQTITALLLLVFVILCVRSFIEARRASPSPREGRGQG